MIPLTHPAIEIQALRRAPSYLHMIYLLHILLINPLITPNNLNELLLANILHETCPECLHIKERSPVDKELPHSKERPFLRVFTETDGLVGDLYHSQFR